MCVCVCGSQLLIDMLKQSRCCQKQHSKRSNIHINELPLKIVRSMFYGVFGVGISDRLNLCDEIFSTFGCTNLVSQRKIWMEECHSFCMPIDTNPAMKDKWLQITANKIYGRLFIIITQNVLNDRHRETCEWCDRTKLKNFKFSVFGSSNARIQKTHQTHGYWIISVAQFISFLICFNLKTESNIISLSAEPNYRGRFIQILFKL